MLGRRQRNAGRPRAGEAGFTLAETLVVVMIVGIVAALGAPSMNTYRRQMNLAGAVQTTKILLYQARLMSIYQGKIHFVVIDSGARTVSIIEDSSAPLGVLNAGDTEITVTRWATTVRLGLPVAPSPIKHPISGATLTGGWSMPAPDAWPAGLVGLITRPNGRILSAEATPATISGGAIVFNDAPGGTGSASVTIDGMSGSVRSYRLDENALWAEL